MQRAKRTSADLAAASEHFWYEVWMFVTLARAIATGIFGAGPVHNAAVESFTLHARVLLDFLFAESPRPDDVAEDFFASAEEWPLIRGDMPPVLKQVSTRVGKEVAHLTYARLSVTPETKGWPYLEIAAAMDQLVGKFLSHVPREHLGQSWLQQQHSP
jgi:hypothetical protein